MKVEGCSNPGLSFTSKYKNAIINIFDFVNTKCVSDEYDYSQFQNMVSQETTSDNSEVRMLIPFLLKAGILDENNVVRGGSRIRRVKINNSFFTYEGVCFVEFLIIEKNAHDLSIKQRTIIERIYKKFGLIIFNHLVLSDEPIYRDLLNFLRKYNTIDKIEFFLLTDCRKKSCLNLLDDYIYKYRNDIINENNIEIINNVNSYQYITNLLQQIGILDKNSTGRFCLGTLIREMEVVEHE